MNIDKTISNLNSMTVTDRLRVVAAIWDAIPDSHIQFTTPEQDAELNRRFEQHRKDPSSSITCDELRSKLADN